MDRTFARPFKIIMPERPISTIKIGELLRRAGYFIMHNENGTYISDEFRILSLTHVDDFLACTQALIAGVKTSRETLKGEIGAVKTLEGLEQDYKMLCSLIASDSLMCATSNAQLYDVSMAIRNGYVSNFDFPVSVRRTSELERLVQTFLSFPELFV